MSDIETIFRDTLNGRMDAASVTEANDRTIPGGAYRLEVTKKELMEADERSMNPGRLIVRVQADALAKQEDGSFQKKGKVFFTMSPVVMRKANGKLDSASKLWAQVLGILGREGTNQGVYDYLGQYPMRGTVTRPLVTLAGEFVNPKSKEEEDRLLSDGAEPKNFVLSLGAWNG